MDNKHYTKNYNTQTKETIVHHQIKRKHYWKSTGAQVQNITKYIYRCSECVERKHIFKGSGRYWLY